jgi:hypothetical protein
MANFKTYGFNSLKFDLPITIGYGNSHNADPEWAHDFAQKIIDRDDETSQSKITQEFGLKWGWDQDYLANHYDIKDVAFGAHSLKFYAAVMGLPELQDLPYHHDAMLAPDEKRNVFLYCIKDCYATYRLRQALAEPMAIRAEFGRRFGIDLRSKKDAAVAEQLLLRDYELKTGKKPVKPDLPNHFKIPFKVPKYISFKSAELKALADELNAMMFDVVGGKVILGAMEGRIISIAGKPYKMGVGGLHSQESKITHRADEKTLLIDCDVASYYPNMILRNGYYPPSLGRQMLLTYDGFVQQRMAAKKTGDKLMVNGIKIPLNATFGKLGEKHSMIFAPEMFLNITISGQLGLLSLIESFTMAKFEVISANTDGVITIVPKARLEEYRAILKEWMDQTDLILEETHYKAVHSRDVNSYLAIYADDSGYKAKGAYSAYGLSSLQAKVPNCQVVKDAIIQYLWKDIPIEKTIRECKNFLDFTVNRNVKSGGFCDGVSLGRVVRFYYSDKSNKKIVNAAGGSVPDAYNVEPCMDLPDSFPSDLSYPTYIAKAAKMLASDFHQPRSFGDLFAGL